MTIMTKPISEKEAQTIDYYHRNAEQWSSNYDSAAKASFWLPDLQIFSQYLQSGHVLDIGVGGQAKQLIF